MVAEEQPEWFRILSRVRDPQFLFSPYFARSVIGSAAFGYGVYSITACLLLKRQLPVWRGALISIPASSALLGWNLTREDPIFVYNS